MLFGVHSTEGEMIEALLDFIQSRFLDSVSIERRPMTLAELARMCRVRARRNDAHQRDRSV